MGSNPTPTATSRRLGSGHEHAGGLDTWGGRPMVKYAGPAPPASGLQCPLWRESGRRRFLCQAGGLLLGGLATTVPGIAHSTKNAMKTSLFLGGDVMTGRGIDQILRHPGDPVLYERTAKSALTYLELAEQASGPIPRMVEPGYIWGDALAILGRAGPDARIVNLETAVTTASDHWVGKAVHYRMHPANVDCLAAARLDCCSLANNHVLDWSYVGLRETLAALKSAGIRTVGAGDSMAESAAPATVSLASRGRVLVFGYGSPTAGVPREWLASKWSGGVNGIDESDAAAAPRVAAAVRQYKRDGDVVVVSIHWGGNWGYDVSDAQRRLAHALIDDANVDVVFGHSSHHPRPIEVHAGKLILYGCGDLLNDYEGIGGHERFRPELGFMYLPEIDARNGRLQRLQLRPTRVRKFRITSAVLDDAEWLRAMLDREGRAYGTGCRYGPDGVLELSWS